MWSPLLHRALDMAKAAGPRRAGRPCLREPLQHCTRGRMRIVEGEGVLVEGIAYCDEHDISTFGNCLRGDRTVVLEQARPLGRVRGARDRLLRPDGPSPVNRLNPLLSLAKIRARRGDPDAADVPRRGATTWPTGLDEQEWIVLASTARAEACWLEGRADAALDELAAADGRSAPAGRPSSAATLAVWRYRIAGSAAIDRAGLIEPFATEVAGDASSRARTSSGTTCGLRYDAALALLGSTDESVLRDALARLEALGAAPAARYRHARRCAAAACRSVPSGVRAYDEGAPGRAHPPRARGARAPLRGPHQRRDRRPACSSRSRPSTTTCPPCSAKLDVPSRRLAARRGRPRGLVGAAT